MPTCYRHPAIETGVACSNCGRPICPDCMTPTSVGMRCPECARERTEVHTARSIGAGAGATVTTALIAVCVVAFLAGGSFGIGESSTTSWLYREGALWGPYVEDGELWRLITSGFLHSGLLHVGFNMLLLWWLGSEIEGRIGPGRFAAVYVTALLGGSLGALVQTTQSVTVGASGAVFGLMGYLLVEQRRQGISFLQSQIGILLLFNVVLSLRPDANISFGGHLGGLVLGAVAAVVLHETDRRGPRWLGPAVLAGLCVACVLGAVVMAGSPGITDDGLGA